MDEPREPATPPPSTAHTVSPLPWPVQGPPAPAPFDAVDEGVDFADAGYIPPDPDEPPPLELWRLPDQMPPFGTILLLLSWAVAFAWMAAHGEGGDTQALLAHGANVTQRPGADALLRLVASTFLHASPSHIFFNAITLLMFGPGVERLFTRASFAILVAFGGAVASAASLAWRLARHGVGVNVSVGGSGVLFALGGALLAASFRLRHRLAVGRARALAAAVLFLAAQAFVGGLQQMGTDNAAHTGGLLAGVLLGLTLPLDAAVSGQPAPRAWTAAGAASTCVLIAGFVRALLVG